MTRRSEAWVLELERAAGELQDYLQELTVERARLDREIANVKLAITAMKYTSDSIDSGEK